MKSLRRVVGWMLVAAVVGAPAGVAHAQDGAEEQGDEEQTEVVVDPTADADEQLEGEADAAADEFVDVAEVEVVEGRLEGPAEEGAGKVTVIDKERIDRQLDTGLDFGDMLAREVPGLATSTETMSNSGQTLRGRKFLVLVDGVPQSTPLRDVQRDLNMIDPQVVEQVEVVRGSSSLYGFGATGGIINIVTARADQDGWSGRSELGAGSSVHELADGARWQTNHRATYRNDAFDVLLHGSFAQHNGLFDAAGDRVPADPHGQGGIADSNKADVLGKAGYQLDDDQRLEATFNYFRLDQDTDYVTAPGSLSPRQKATAQEGELQGEPIRNEGIMAQVAYDHDEVIGSELSAKAYYQENEAMFRYHTNFDPPGQSYLDSQKLGARLDLRTPFELAELPFQFTWGADAQRDETAQPLTDGRSWVPPMTQYAAAGFGQLKGTFFDSLIVHGGARYEHLWLTVDDYNTLATSTEESHAVAGGNLTYDALLFNVGASYFLINELELFAGFNQGFSVADVGRALRGTSADSVEAFDPEPQLVDNYEVGIAGEWPAIRAELTGFYNTSELGTTFDGPNFEILRRPERVWGVESSLTAQPIDTLTLGGSATWMEGKMDADEDGEFENYLDGTRIPPLKLTAFVEHQTTSAWSNRVQLLHSGSRDRFEAPGDQPVYGQGRVDPYTLIDLHSRYALEQGTVSLGVRNLLNTEYYPVLSQARNFDSTLAQGQGATVHLGYELDW